MEHISRDHLQRFLDQLADQVRATVDQYSRQIEAGKPCDAAHMRLMSAIEHAVISLAAVAEAEAKYHAMRQSTLN